MASSQMDGNLVVNGNVNCGGNLLIGTTNVATALGDRATTVNLDLKAPKRSPAFTGTATAAALTVNGALLVGTTNVATALGEKATTANLDLKAPKESPTFTGTATAAALTVNGALLIGTTNVMTALGEKALEAHLALKTNVSRTSNSAVAWSEGLSDSPTHWLSTGTASLSVRTNTGLTSAAFFGDAGPGGWTKDGNITFYKNFEVQGATTAANLTVSGALVVGTTNVATALAAIPTPAALDLKAPKESPTFSGTATAAALTVNGDLLVGTTNVVSALNLKANASDFYTKAQIENTLQPKISSFAAPLKYTTNVLTGFNSLSIDPTVFQPVMPWASCLITTASNGSAVVFSLGFQSLTTDNLTRVGSNSKAYKITFPTPHPNGSLFAVIAVPYTSSSDSWDYTNNTDYICTSKGESSLGMSVGVGVQVNLIKLAWSTDHFMSTLCLEIVDISIA
jgi:hypothetical protein